MPKREERMLRSMLPCAGQPPAETDPAPDVSSAEVKPCSRGKELPDTWNINGFNNNK